MRASTDRVTSTEDESSELMQRFIPDNMSGGELLVLYIQRGYVFYTMRGGVNNEYDKHEGSGYDY
jgi:hypothetical protein